MKSKVRGQLNQRRAQRTFRAVLNNHNVAMLSVLGKTALVDWKAVRDIAPTPMVMSAFNDYPHFWTVYALVWTRDYDGKNRLNYHELCVLQQRMFRQLQNHHSCKGCPVCAHLVADDVEGRTGPIQPYLDEVVDSYNPAYVLGSGWLAVPKHDPGITQEQLYALADAAGVWSTGEETLYEKQQRQSTDSGKQTEGSVEESAGSK